MSRILGFGLAAIVLLPIAASILYLSYAHFIESPKYADHYFEGLAEVERIEASRRWHWGRHPWGGRAYGCSFAIATLPEDASIEPPRLAEPRRHPWGWPAEWDSTPVVTEDGHHEVLEECAYALPRNLVARLRAAHDAPGSYYEAGLELLFLYAPEHRLIARIRFGD